MAAPLSEVYHYAIFTRLAPAGKVFLK